MAEYTNRKLREDINILEEELRDKAADGTITVTEENLWNKIKTDPSYGQKFVQGTTLGSSDEIGSFATSLFPDQDRDMIVEVLRDRTGEKISNYDLDLAQSRRNLDALRGYRASATEFAGAVLPYVVGGKTKLLKKFMNPKTWKGAAGAGAADTGIYGFMTGEGWEDRWKKGTLYGLGGGILGPAVKGGGHLLGKIKRFVSPPGKEAAIKDARKLIAETLQVEGMTVKDAIAKVLAGKNSKITLADLGDTNTLSNYLQAVRELDGPSFAEAAKKLKNRSLGKAGRLYHLFSGKSKAGNLIDNLMMLKTARKKESNSFYQNAFHNFNRKTGAQGSLKTMKIGEELNQIFQTPNFKHAFNHARDLALEKGQKFPFQLVDGVILNAKTGKKVNNMPTLYLHYMKKGYDDYLSAIYKNPNAGTLQTQAINANKNKLINFISKDKNYSKGRDIYSGSYDIAKSLELGDSITKGNISYHDIVRQLKTFNTSQKEAFRIAAVDAIVFQIEKIGVDPALRRFVKSDNNKKLLKLAFTGNADLSKPSKKFDKFYNNLMNELNIKMTENAILGGSKTAPVLQTAKQITKDAPIMSFGADSIIRSLLGDVSEKAGLEYKEALGKELSRILTTFDANDLKILEKQVAEGKSWKEIIKAFPNVFGSLLRAPFSPQGIGFTVQEAGNLGYGDIALGELEGQLEHYGILR